MLASGSCIRYLFLCSLPMQVQQQVELKAILSDDIIVRISDTSEGIRVSWTSPDTTIDPHCYESELRYKSICDTDWLIVMVRKFFHDVRPDRKKRYEFQVRMRYNRLCGIQKESSTWTRKMSWGNTTQTEPCTVDGYCSFYLRLSLGTILPPGLAVILAFVFFLKRIRRTFLPSIPGPKPSPDKLLSIVQFECQYAYTETRDWEIVDIEIVSVGRSTEGDKKDEREKDEVNTEDESHCVDLSDAGLYDFSCLVENGAYLKFSEQEVDVT